MIKIVKEKYPQKEIGHSNAKFYGYALTQCGRLGTVWKFNDGTYVMNEDFNSRRHNNDNRPLQVKGKTIKELHDNLVYIYGE